MQRPRLSEGFSASLPHSHDQSASRTSNSTNNPTGTALRGALFFISVWAFNRCRLLTHKSTSVLTLTSISGSSPDISFLTPYHHLKFTMITMSQTPDVGPKPARFSQNSLSGQCLPDPAQPSPSSIHASFHWEFP